MAKHLLAGTAIAALVAAASVGLAGQAAAQPGPGYGGGWGPGWMGPGMMWGGGYGPGYGGPGPGYGGWGPGWMGPGMMWGGGYGPWYGGAGPEYGGWGPQQSTNLNLTVAQVKGKMEQWIQASGNPHVKLGAVTQKDADTITADIVTADTGSLVEEYDINRQTGEMQPAPN